MPTRAVVLEGRSLVLDARPDRLDLRDLPYRPPVCNLPAAFPGDDDVQHLLSRYLDCGLILDQRNEGACTGFGLAAVINYLRWFQSGMTLDGSERVSPRMLYHLARFYDEWPGEDYEGSSCRGALKGWHRHGVCTEALWPYADAEGAFVRPGEGWDSDAIRRPLGVYYRVQYDSVVDLQSAIHETGAIYVSGTVHDGWNVPSVRQGVPIHRKLPVIRPCRKGLGGHAFAMVGFNDTGFVVQNSWGPDWGWWGFAVLPYDDWIANGADAWVVGIGTPVTRAVKGMARGSRLASPQHFVHGPARALGRMGTGSWLGGPADPLARRRDVWTEQKAYWHTLVTGNDGCIVNRLPQVEDERDNVRFVAREQPDAWFTSFALGGPRRLAVYAHGGLNAEAESVKRIRVLGPNFEANGIYPLFVTWKSGWLETLVDMLADKANEAFGALPSRGLGDALTEAMDRALEALSRKFLARSMWSEMKENVARSSDPGRGIDALAEQIEALHEESGGQLEIHLIGHSAGAFVCGRLLSEMEIRGLTAASCTLFAPACDLEFANLHFAKAVKEARLPREKFRIHVLSDDLEKDDSVGPYRKSLLYLVCRALERWHKTPLLGLASAFDAAFSTEEFWHPATLGQLEQWRAAFWADAPVPSGFARDGAGLPEGKLQILRSRQVETGAGRIKSAHGSFDNSREHIGGAIEAIRGKPLAKAITPLNF